VLPFILIYYDIDLRFFVIDIIPFMLSCVVTNLFLITNQTH